MASLPRNLVQRFRVRELKRALAPEGATSSPGVSVINPFLPSFNEVTGRWAPPRYSLRRQAELIKNGRLEGTLHLLPPGPKLNPLDIFTAKPKRAAAKTKGMGKRDKPIIDVTTRIKWIGEVKNHDVAGADIGNTLYAGKKQMFKGHKWERVIKRRRHYQRILMRSMKRRILRWRLVRIVLR
jgi:large subunit ribosomal protein L25